MASISVSLYLDKRSKSEDHFVKIRLTRDRKSEYIPIHEYRLKADEWDGRLCVNRKDARKVNAFLLARLEQVSSYVRELTLSRKASTLPLKSIRDKAERFMEDGTMTFRDVRTFGEVWKDFLAARRHEGTQRVYGVRLSALRRFCPDVESMPIDSFKRSFALDYIAWLKADGKSNNTIISYSHALTGPLWFAVGNGELDSFPFHNLDLSKNQSRHKNIPIDKLREILTVKDHCLQKHYDLFAFSFFMRGMNLADMLTARRSDIVNGRLEYDRHKTGTHYSVKIEPEAQAIMDRYPSKTHLLSFLEGKSQVYSNTVNSELKKSYGITMYHARHSVATIASDLDIPLDHIALILGHKNPVRVITLIYVNYDNRKADDAMRRIIDYVLYGKE